MISIHSSAAFRPSSEADSDQTLGFIRQEVPGKVSDCPADRCEPVHPVLAGVRGRTDRLRWMRCSLYCRSSAPSGPVGNGWVAAILIAMRSRLVPERSGSHPVHTADRPWRNEPQRWPAARVRPGVSLASISRVFSASSRVSDLVVDRAHLVDIPVAANAFSAGNQIASRWPVHVRFAASSTAPPR